VSKKEILNSLREAVLNFDVEAARRAAEEAVKTGIEPTEAVHKALAPALKEVGEKFHRYEVFLPHLVLAGDAMTEAMNVFEPTMTKEQAAKLRTGTIVLGTVEGDLHDIGKNVVAMILKSEGFVVHDIGKDVKTAEFIDKAQAVDADAIGVSSLMTTTIPYQRELVEELERLGLRERFKVVVGGGPVTAEWAEQIGADGYGRDATEAAKVVKELLVVKES
jgi:corrinoid protein of di/trimethylamine methyltransferase